MLNFIYYPVSAIMWFWHEVFGFVLGPANGFGWALSVIFLVFTLRALLIKPFISQVRSMRKMQEFQPQIKKLQEKYKNDRTKLAEEMQKLQKEHGVNPLGGCLPLLVQLPVFIGLFHVLRGFQPNYPYNYVFDRADIESFTNADIFGVRLNEAIAGGMQSLGTFSFNFGNFQSHVVPVALPLMILAAVATHFTARVSQQHQSPAAAANPQAAIMGKITMWLFPAGLLVFGAFFPIAILIYFLSQNSWTLGQQFLIYRKIAREEEEKREQAREQRDALAPRPGQKPQRQRPLAGDADTTAADTAAEDDVVVADEPAPTTGQPTGGSGGGGSKKGSGRRAPGKLGPSRGGGGQQRQGSGRPAPGKVARASGNGAGQTGGKGSGGGGNGSHGTNGSNGSNGAKGGQLASSGQGKRPKKKK
ncbi:membrane protein insertase YidC [Actinomycetospora sp. CA-101289]|uniref:membrane protein insertase YidC n=1 Tax=Actinomycetospora sp. CA-101289 TaxID=3239893 RepID=UPI003D99752C